MNKKNTILLTIIAMLALTAAVAFGIAKDKQASPLYPVIEFNSDTIDVSVNATEADLLAGVTATDPEDGDVTDSLVIEGVSKIIEGTSMKIAYAAFDSQNHVTKAERTVSYVDYTRPRFWISRPLVFGTAGKVDFMQYVRAGDVFEGDISSRIKYSLINSISIDGTDEYDIKLSVTNKVGDTVTLPITVSVSDEYAYSDLITLSDYLIYIGCGTPFDAKSYVVSYMSGEKEVKSAKGLTITGDVNTDVPGIYNVEYSYSKPKSKMVIKTRLVVIVE